MPLWESLRLFSLASGHELSAINSQIADVLQFLQKITLVKNQSRADCQRTQAEEQVQHSSVCRKEVLEPPNPAAKGQSTRSGDEDEVESFERHTQRVVVSGGKSAKDHTVRNIKPTKKNAVNPKMP